VLSDYKNNRLKTLPDVEMRMKLHVLPFFSGRFAQSLRTADIEAYKTKRLNEEAAVATINRELSIVQRAFSLGVEQDLIMNQFCKVKKFKEDNACQGFVTQEEFETLCKHLPADVSAPVRFAFETGWRMNSEILTRTWANVDFNSGIIRLESDETKNGESRVFPLTAKLRKILEEQKIIHQDLIRNNGLFCSLVFHHDGKPMIYRDKRG
jgi:integrase